MNDFFAIFDTILTFLFIFLFSVVFTAACVNLALLCFHWCGLLLNVKWSWTLSLGVWILRVLFGGITNIEMEEEE